VGTYTSQDPKVGICPVCTPPGGYMPSMYPSWWVYAGLIASLVGICRVNSLPGGYTGLCTPPGVYTGLCTPPGVYAGYTHPGIYALPHHPGYTIPLPALVPDTRHAGHETGIPRLDEQLHNEQLVTCRLPSSRYRHPFHCWLRLRTLLRRLLLPKVIPYG